MFFRIVRLKLREGGFWPFREYYEATILPALAQSEGCTYAALLRPAAGAASGCCDSLTLWESEAHADAYVTSGVYDGLLDGADPWLAAATEWKTDLAGVGPEKRPPLTDPEVATYPVEVGREADVEDDAAALFLRIVDHRVDPARYDELKRAYSETLVPALLETPGCLAAYLVEGLRGRSQALSVTFWSDEASAIRYETSGRFDELAALLRPYLSGLYQWRLSLAPAGEKRDLRGSDLAISGFEVVSGRRLRKPGA